MNPTPTFPLQIFYDGSCSVCAGEMAIYRRKNPENRLRFIDISDDRFDPRAYDKPLEDFMAKLHARDREGRWFEGVDAFVALWRAFPSPSGYRLLAAAVSLPGIKHVARVGYRLFARYRKHLPKSKKGCDDDRCRPGHRR